MVSARGVVVAVALAAHRGFDTGFGQALAVANGYVLRPAIAMVDQGAAWLWLARVKRLFQGIQNKVRSHRTADAPSHDASEASCNSLFRSPSLSSELNDRT